jgi:hypothetical protein
VTPLAWFSKSSPFPQSAQRSYGWTALLSQEFTLFYTARHLVGPGLLNRGILQGNGYGTTYYGYIGTQKDYFNLDGVRDGSRLQLLPLLGTFTHFREDSNGLMRYARYGSNINTQFTSGGFDGLGIGIGNDSNRMPLIAKSVKCMVFDRNLTPTECSAIENYYVYKYGLQNYVPYPNPSPLMYQASNTHQPYHLQYCFLIIKPAQDLKLWFDATQIPLIAPHTYFTSTIKNVFSLLPLLLPVSQGSYDAPGIFNFLHSSTNNILNTGMMPSLQGRQLVSEHLYQHSWYTAPRGSLSAHRPVSSSQTFLQ